MASETVQEFAAAVIFGNPKQRKELQEAMQATEQCMAFLRVNINQLSAMECRDLVQLLGPLVATTVPIVNRVNV